MKQAEPFHPAGPGQLTGLEGRKVLLLPGNLPVDVGKCRFHEQMVHPIGQGDYFLHVFRGAGRIGNVRQALTRRNVHDGIFQICQRDTYHGLPLFRCRNFNGRVRVGIAVDHGLEPLQPGTLSKSPLVQRGFDNVDVKAFLHGKCQDGCPVVQMDGPYGQGRFA